MYVRPRPRFRPRNAGGVPFSPALLFTSGVAGAWYDPSDINNYMAGLGPELVTNGSFSSSSNWLTTGNSSVSGGTGNLDGTAVAGLLYQAGIFSNGKCYQVEFDVVSITGTLKCWNNDGTTIYSTTTSGRKSFTYIHAIASSNFLFRADLGGNIASVDNVSVREVTTIANATLFQDSAGTTPVTAVEQPVGLMLDKSQGLAITPTAIDGNLNTATWTKGTGWSAPSARSLVCDGSQTGSSDTSASYTKPTGALVRWSFTISAISGTLTVYPTGGAPSTFTTTGAKTVCSDAASNFNIFRMGAGQTCTITEIRIEIIAGNHASQATAASRPVLRARYNLMTYSEQFDNAAWNKLSAGTGSVPVVTANYATAPDGTTTADRVVFDRGAGTTASDISYLNQSITSISADCTGSIWMRTTDGSTKVISFRVGNTFNYTASVTGTWTRFTLTGTSPVARLDLLAYGDRSAQVTDLLVWGADLRTGSSAGTYQRIAAATDYATAGFLPYLYFVTDDSFGTNSINFSATDAMFSCVGITKNSDAANALVYELSADITSNNGAVNLFAPIVSGGLNTYYAASKGTVSAIAGTGTGVYVAPITNVVSTVSDISTPSLALRVNGSQVATSTATQGTGNFGNYPLFIGRRNNASLPFNGNLYQLIVCGKELSASELASTEAYVNQKTGAY